MTARLPAARVEVKIAAGNKGFGPLKNQVLHLWGRYSEDPGDFRKIVTLARHQNGQRISAWASGPATLAPGRWL